MRRLIVVIIFILGLIPNELMSQPPPPPPIVPWDPFNVVPNGEIARRARNLCYLIYPALQVYMNQNIPNFQALSQRIPEAFIEAFHLNVRLSDVIQAFNRMIGADAVEPILNALFRVPATYYSIGAVSLAINRPLVYFTGLRGNQLQLRSEQLATEALFRIGYVLVGRPRYPEFQLTLEEAWPIIISWLMQINI